MAKTVFEGTLKDYKHTWQDIFTKLAAEHPSDQLNLRLQSELQKKFGEFEKLLLATIKMDPGFVKESAGVQMNVGSSPSPAYIALVTKYGAKYKLKVTYDQKTDTATAEFIGKHLTVAGGGH